MVKLMRKWNGKSILIRGVFAVDMDRTIQTRITRLDFPRFDGFDPSGWLYRAEQFFVHQQAPTSQKLLMASFHM